ncbi:hypothetical protein SBV1_810013 [Verrucomicrobia bacterium]|nr:hypothetical protein SBV1_810013 [Verrucomicrobiota bacterium]
MDFVALPRRMALDAVTVGHALVPQHAVVSAIVSPELAGAAGDGCAGTGTFGSRATPGVRKG